MDDDREMVVNHILSIDKLFYRYLQLGIMPNWAEIDLTMPQLKVLFLAGGPRPMPASQIARSLGMTLPTATGVVDRLVAQGLVRRLQDPNDRRVVLLQATEEGAQLVERLLRTSLGHFRAILNRLSFDELRTVGRALDLLYEAAVSLSADSPWPHWQRNEHELAHLAQQQAFNSPDSNTCGTSKGKY